MPSEGALDQTSEQAQWLGMPKRKEPKLTPAEQFKIFRETAKRHGLDESGKELEEAFKRLAPTKDKQKKER